jgi:hypothetical protein
MILFNGDCKSFLKEAKKWAVRANVQISRQGEIRRSIVLIKQRAAENPLQ